MADQLFTTATQDVCQHIPSLLQHLIFMELDRCYVTGEMISNLDFIWGKMNANYSPLK